MKPRLFHFSEDSSITRFLPHVARTATETEPLVWAVDEAHAPSYWFPRHCPRTCCWKGQKPVTESGHPLLAFGGGVSRMHAIENDWLERVRACKLYAYEFDPAPFREERPSAGYWVSRAEASVISVTPVGDLLARHADAGIELRIVPNLWPLIDAIIGSGLEFSIIRKMNAQPREVLGLA